MSKYHAMATKVYRQRVASILGLNVDHVVDAALNSHLEEHDDPISCAKSLCLEGYPLGHRARKLL